MQKEDRVAWAKIKKFAFANDNIGLEEKASILTRKLFNVAWEYYNYGRFFANDITNVFAIFVSYIEGEKYIPYRNFENQEITEGSIIIKETVNNQYDKIDCNTLEELYEYGDLIRLNSGTSNMVDFYDFVSEPNYFFGKFNYLREFVNRLIQYRIDNRKESISDITIDELYSFMVNFISTHPDLAQKSKDKREQMLMEQSEEKIIAGCKKLKKALK